MAIPSRNLMLSVVTALAVSATSILLTAESPSVTCEASYDHRDDYRDAHSDDDEDDYAMQARPFLEAHCLRCHSGEKPKAELDLDRYRSTAQLLADRRDWVEVRDRVRHHEMPPKGEPRPSTPEIDAFVAWVHGVLTRPLTTTDPGRAPPRRLNRVEYRNTVRDLLGVDFDSSERFPADDVAHGFDNNADVLSLSPLLLEKYLAAAETIAARAVRDPSRDGPPSETRPAAELKSSGRLYGRVVSMSTSGETYFDHEIAVEGRYRIQATCHGQQAGPEVVKADFRIDQRKVKTVDVAATREKPGLYHAEVRLEPGSRRIGIAFVNDYYNPKDPDPTQRDRNMVVHAMELIGPLDTVSLTPFQRRWLAETPDARDGPEVLRRAVAGVAERAFRRPVTPAEIDALLTVVGASSETDDSLEARLRVAITALLVSPRFLFRLETRPASVAEPEVEAETKSRPLDDFELASRLSYFLWSSMPDDALFEAARRGELANPEGLVRQVRRMLRDPRSLSLAENFATQWLQIRDLEQHEPDPVRFPRVDRSLREAMRRETVLLFDAVLRENRSVWTLLDADFTFVNEPLAELYGLGGVDGPWMRRVPVGSRGGGVLAHASVLTATSNATRTSPVKRGKWILDALLDSPPPPPPPSVEGLKEEEAGRDGVSLRELLEQHRQDPSCSTCHLRMDALGFGLESFDPVGRVRERDGRHPIDDVGELPDGRTFRGVAGLRATLLGDRDFLRSTAKHLMVYGLGRGVRPADEPALERVTAALELDPTLERAITEIVQLDAFRCRRVDSRGE